MARILIAALTISLHAGGPTNSEFKTILDQYEQFLRKNGFADDADATAQIVQKLDASDLGLTAPDAWRPLSPCTAKAN